ncbi:hypothetical protein KI387_040924, partial [Taxus chinensis]
SDMAGDLDSMRSMIGYVFTVGDTMVSWISRLQKVVDFSTTEAKYVSAIEEIKEMIWLQHFLDDLGHKEEVGRLHSDIQS